MRLEIRHLELVVAIAESGSLGRAAARLHLSRPAVTTQLKRIETFVGGALFIRSTGGVFPTHTGAELVREARRLLHQFTALQRTARMNAQDESGAPVKVGGRSGQTGQPAGRRPDGDVAAAHRHQPDDARHGNPRHPAGFR
jgi:molybdate transport repressor ModE-like protein